MADICAATGADVSALARSLGLDPRIGKTFLKAGIGYGGACLPKDVRGLRTFAHGVGADNAAMLLGAVDAVNAARSDQVVNACRGISATAWRDAGWQVSSLTGARSRQSQEGAPLSKV